MTGSSPDAHLARMVFSVRVRVMVRVRFGVTFRFEVRFRFRVRPFSRSREVRFWTRPPMTAYDCQYGLNTQKFINTITINNIKV